jgi:hypothetical protein
MRTTIKPLLLQINADAADVIVVREKDEKEDDDE